MMRDFHVNFVTLGRAKGPVRRHLPESVRKRTMIKVKELRFKVSVELDLSATGDAMKSRRRILAALPLLIVSTFIVPAPARAGDGAPFGARDPVVCASTQPPATGAPSPAQVRQYVACGYERMKGSGSLAELYLTENVTVEIGAGRPFEFGDGQGDVDVKLPIYPIRGSLTYYRCYPLNSAHPPGQSCKKVEWPHAAGQCYKTTFGDWKCYMTDTATSQTVAGYYPAPR